MQERRWVRIGGWAALAAGVLTLAQIAAQIASVAARTSPGDSQAVLSVLAAGAVFALTGVAVALSALGAGAVLRAASWVTRWGTGAGTVGGLALPVGAVAHALGIAGGVLAGSFGWVLIGLWMISVAAAGWRLRRLPGWLRIYGAAVGALLMLLPALPETASLDLLLSLPWWFGLGSALFRFAKAPLIPAEAGTQA